MSSPLFAAFLLLSLIIASTEAKYSDFDAHGSEAENVARKLLKQFAVEQEIDAGRLKVLDVLEARKQDVYSPNNKYNLGKIYTLRLAVGVQKCVGQNYCPVNQALLIDSTLLSVLNQQPEYSFKVLDSQMNQ